MEHVVDVTRAIEYTASGKTTRINVVHGVRRSLLARIQASRRTLVPEAVLGMEGVVCGPGGRYNTMPDERVDIPDYLDMIRIYMRVIMDICGVAEA